MPDKAAYLAGFRRDADAFADAARSGPLDAPVPSCPGWTVASLVAHLTVVYAHKLASLRSRAAEDTVQSYADLDLPPEFRETIEGLEDPSTSTDPVKPGLVELYEATTDRLEAALTAADPAERVWTWWPAEQNAGFWQRRMAQETAVHRWDAEAARGDPQPIDPEIARDGIDEALDVMLPTNRQWAEHPRPGEGESYHFHRTDGPGEWLVRFEGDGATVTREHAKGDVALRGPASDLLLWLWGRIPAGHPQGGSELDVVGDASLLPRYFELVPPD